MELKSTVSTARANGGLGFEPGPVQRDSDVIPSVEFLTAEELAAKLKVKPSWVVEQTKPSRTSDPIPTVRLGKHVRYAWGSKAFMAWLERRFN